MSFLTTTFSTTDSIVRHQTRILTIANYTTGSGGQWDMKFDLSREKLYNDLNSRFGSNYNLDYIQNTGSLCIASDYLTLALVYTQLATNGLNQVWQVKKEHYWKQYAYELSSCIPRLTFSNNQRSVITSGRFIV